MEKVKRRKDDGSFLTKYFRSFKHSVDGIVYSIEQEINIILIMVLTLMALGVGFMLEISKIELCLVVLSMGAVMASELINCAIEATVDLVTLDIHPLAKIAKDCASSATLILVFGALFVNGIIFIPKIIELF